MLAFLLGIEFQQCHCFNLLIIVQIGILSIFWTHFGRNI